MHASSSRRLHSRWFFAALVDSLGISIATGNSTHLEVQATIENLGTVAKCSLIEPIRRPVYLKAVSTMSILIRN